jgi:protein-L-isoaspartate O-methyltransferase
VHYGDFLQCNGDLGKFDRILMNPPFERGDDIKHIQHAVTFLKPGGRLVAICANGPRQNATLKPQAEDSGGIYEPLPEGTFKEQGTGVNTALLIVEG